MPSLAARTLYSLSQTARVGFFLANRYASNKISGPIVNWAEVEGDFPSLNDLLRDMRALFSKDWANIEAGYYPMPDDVVVRPSYLLRGALRYFSDLPNIHRRRSSKSHQEVLEEAEAAGWLQRFPRYYLQNFHYQSGGWLSEASAKRYDYQVEVVFLGAADAMRRQALPPLVEYARMRPGHRLQIVDLACGTGRFLNFVKAAIPRAKLTGIDLSPAYITEAKRCFRRAVFTQGALEDLPLARESQDAAACIFTFHELPHKIRAKTAQEIGRILKPGGLYVHVDSVQKGDYAPYDDLLDIFPEGFHEPYYASYVREDLSALFAAYGLDLVSEQRAFFSKISVFKKRGD